MNSLLVFTFLLSFISFVVCQRPETLTNTAVYTFYNRGDRGFLTSIGQSSLVATDVWRDTGSQKWRVFKAYTSTTYMVKPTSEESNALYTQSTRILGNRHPVVKGYSGFGMSSTQFWMVVKAEWGYYNLRNSDSNECLESGGLGKAVITGPCTNSPLQQWALHVV